MHLPDVPYLYHRQVYSTCTDHALCCLCVVSCMQLQEPGQRMFIIQGPVMQVR